VFEEEGEQIESGRKEQAVKKRPIGSMKSGLVRWKRRRIR